MCRICPGAGFCLQVERNPSGVNSYANKARCQNNRIKLDNNLLIGDDSSSGPIWIFRNFFWVSYLGEPCVKTSLSLYDENLIIVFGPENNTINLRVN